MEQAKFSQREGKNTAVHTQAVRTIHENYSPLSYKSELCYQMLWTQSVFLGLLAFSPGYLLVIYKPTEGNLKNKNIV